eukprot:g8861.t1
MHRFNGVIFATLSVGCRFVGGSAQYESCTNGTVADIGNGRCDAELNVPSCGYDGGDCCSCTCSDSATHSCSDNSFDCIFPDCGGPAAILEGSTCIEEWKGDGYCDARNHGPQCDYDGGDCCECSCIDSSVYRCGVSGFACEDPACFDATVVAEFPDCNENWLSIGDGFCDTELNVPSCGYDGGDCCACSCSGLGCLTSIVDCLDPNEEDVVFECKPPPTSTPPCSAEARQTWVVETSAQARALAVAVNCSGGSFEVEWRGTVVMDKPIFVVGGTVLTVTGDGTSAVIDGNGSTRLFTLSDNAALSVSSLNITNGASIAGGAIAAAGSSLTLTRTNFVNNSATSRGGALYVSGGSSVSCAGGGIFADNMAQIEGGAMFMTGGSVVACAAAWVSNEVGDTGGAIVVNGSSSLSWGDDASFVSNRAGRTGGAVSLSDDSTLSWSAGTVFNSNSAEFFGGVLSVLTGSNVSWSASSLFLNNMVEDEGIGGAVYASTGSVVSWSGSTSFEGNEAGYQGGALAVFSDSTASWNGVGDSVFEGNRAGVWGGALVVSTRSHVSCGEETTSIFSENSAEHSAGAIFVDIESSLSFSGACSFDGNRALGYGGGGALATYDSTVSLGGLTTFHGNHAAAGDGGAVWAYNSRVEWHGSTEMSDNSALLLGGALFVASSVMVWRANATFVGNHVDGDGAGGTICAFIGSNVSWEGEMSRFVGSYGGLFGGALFADGANVYWSGRTEFTENGAVTGGAVFLFNGSTVGWSGETEFASNVATQGDGGAVASPALDATFNPTASTLVIGGATTFFHNTCLTGGGGVAVLGACAVNITSPNVGFTENTAGVAGGAIFVSGAAFGPEFKDVSFVSNSAQVGGAVSVFGSGNSRSVFDIQPNSPTTFERCHFVGNKADAAGGAVDSAAGQDLFVDCLFEDNESRTGGALRLAGTATIENCSFTDNISGDESGAAVSNIGFVSNMTSSSFRGNAFSCKPGLFLNFTSGDPYETVCDGCQTTCNGCSFDEPPLVPACSEVLENAISPGGVVTLEMLEIEPGYWRATESSEDILACYNKDACLGGVTGATGYCLEGYEGPYCGVCNNEYTSGPGYVCSKCSNSAGGIVLAVVLAVLVLCLAVAVVLHIMSGQVGEARTRACLERVGRYIPLQSVKIVLVSWQILTQFTSVANVTFPGVYQRFLSGLEIFNFDLSWVLSAGCIVDVDFHDRLLMLTIGPMAAMLFLAATYATAARINRGHAEALQVIWNKHVSILILLTFFVYSSVSSTLFKTCACEELDDQKIYLRADYRIECDSSEHQAFQVYAGLMILLYTVGIPLFYGVLLFRDRKLLRKEDADREESARVASTSDLWKPYRPSVFYYEVIECGRRVLLAGVVVFIYPNTAAQIAITLMIAVFFWLVSEAQSPYESRWDTWISRMGHAVIAVSMYVALLLKVDVSGERDDSQRMFEAFLVATHGCMILSIILETIIVACAVV